MNDLDIKEIRARTGLTQAALAKKIGVDIKTVQNWEAGRNIPRVKYDLLRSLISAPRQEGDQNNVNGDNIKGNNVTVNKSETDRLIDLLSSKEKSLWQIQEEVAAQRRVTEKSQEQIDRLLGIIENMNQKK